MNVCADDLLISLHSGRATTDRIDIGKVNQVKGEGVAQGASQRDWFGGRVQYALDRSIMGALSADGMNRLSIEQVDNRNDAEGMLTMAGERRFTILVHEWVTGGGLSGAELPDSWAAEGRAMRRAIAADFASAASGQNRVIVTSDPRLPSDPGPWTIEPGDSPDRVRELAVNADFTVLIAPETSGILAKLTSDLEDAGARLLGSTPGAVALAGDKARLIARLQQRLIATPPTRTIIPHSGLPRDAVYPAVLKPVDGAGSMDTFYLPDATSLPESARKIPVAILQPFTPGMPMSASFFVGVDGQVWPIAVGIQRIAIQEGRFAYHGGALPAPCREAIPQVAPAIESVTGLRGFVGIDFAWDMRRKRATVFEVNPRPTTSLVGLSRVLPPGVLAEAWLAACDPNSRDMSILLGLVDIVREATRPVSFSANGEVYQVI